MAVVTGSGNGIGRGCALMFAREGATVVGADLDVTGSEETLALAAADGLTIHSVLLASEESGWAAASDDKVGGGAMSWYRNDVGLAAPRRGRETLERALELLACESFLAIGFDFTIVDNTTTRHVK